MLARVSEICWLEHPPPPPPLPVAPAWWWAPGTHWLAGPGPLSGMCPTLQNIEWVPGHLKIILTTVNLWHDSAYHYQVLFLFLTSRFSIFESLFNWCLQVQWSGWTRVILHGISTWDIIVGVELTEAIWVSECQRGMWRTGSWGETDSTEEKERD